MSTIPKITDGEVVEQRKEQERLPLAALLREADNVPDAGELTNSKLEAMLDEARKRNRAKKDV